MSTKLLTTAEAAAILGVTRRRVQALALQGRIKGRLLGRDWLLEAESVRWFRRAKPHGLKS